jgi:endo-1,4-beta-mannosidase
MPTEPPNVTISPEDSVFATYPCASDEESAAYATAVLERLHADGRLGAYWWSWADYPDAIRARLPFDRAPHEAVCGLIGADGSEKAVASALSAFARERRMVVPAADMPMIAAAYYYRTLPKSATTLYDAFLRFVAERRAG